MVRLELNGEEFKIVRGVFIKGAPATVRLIEEGAAEMVSIAGGYGPDIDGTYAQYMEEELGATILEYVPRPEEPPHEMEDGTIKQRIF